MNQYSHQPIGLIGGIIDYYIIVKDSPEEVVKNIKY